MIYDLIIIGAGVVGGAIARKLSAYKLSILALEKEQDVSCGISKANTGIIHSPAFISPGTLKSEMTVKGASAFDELSSELGFRFQKTGALLLAYSKADIPLLQNYIEDGRRNYEAAGLRAPEYNIVKAEELRRYEPEISGDAAAALFLPDAGRIIPYEYATALWENAVRNGVELNLGVEVSSAVRSSRDGGWIVSCPNGAEYRSRFVINAAGHGSNTLGYSAGFENTTIRKVKGQYIILERDAGPEINHILFQVPEKEARKNGKGILVTRTVYGNIMIGPDAVAQDDEMDTSTDPVSLKQVIDGALASIPGLDISRTIKTFAGVRPKPSGGDFIIKADHGFVHLCGIESPGLTSSPAIADKVFGLLREMGLEPVADPGFDPVRKAIVGSLLRLSPEELKRRTLLSPGEDGRIVCRCEQVSEARILDSLNRGIPVLTLDGVKRRTRAGQGRCQGTFCGPRVRRLLSEYHNISEEAVTQRGTEADPERISAADIKSLLRSG